MQGHGFGIAEGQYQPRALAVFRADRAEDIGRFRPLILWRRWPRPTSGPAPGDLVLLADPRFVLEPRSEEHTSELQSLMRISYAGFCLKKKNTQQVYSTHQIQFNHKM